MATGQTATPMTKFTSRDLDLPEFCRAGAAPFLYSTMSFARVKLKAARDFIAKKDFVAARDSAEKVLEFESDNYNA